MSKVKFYEVYQHFNTQLCSNHPDKLYEDQDFRFVGLADLKYTFKSKKEALSYIERELNGGVYIREIELELVE